MSADPARADPEEAVAAVLGPGVRLRPEQARALQALRDDYVLPVARSGAGKTAVTTSPPAALVVHAGPPPSLDAYYQEVGRAGRDGEPATALLVHRAEDSRSVATCGPAAGPGRRRWSGRRGHCARTAR